MKFSMEEIVNYCKKNGFTFPGSEIYGGLANTWDFGPLGVLMKDNIKNLWKQIFITMQTENHLLDSSIFMNNKVWEASGHIGNFSDPLVDCRECKSRFRADHLIENFGAIRGEVINTGSMSFDELSHFIKSNEIACPKCNANNFTEVRDFQLMFRTQTSITGGDDYIYLRPETAQGIFINFKNVQRSMREKLPFGIGQIGKSFRNEITPGNFVFRTKEFEQMELEYFVKPENADSEFEKYVSICDRFLKMAGLKDEDLHKKEIEKEELAHYSSRTIDYEFDFPFGRSELMGIANRTDFDLKAHSKFSGETLEYIDPIDNARITPYVIEPSIGVERLFLAIISTSLVTEQLEDDTRVVLKVNPNLAPYKVAILPLFKKIPAELSFKVLTLLSNYFAVTFDDSGSIGKRYRRQDEIGTIFCLTVDFDSIDDQTFTIRHRDTMIQERVHFDELVNYIFTKMNNF